MSFYNFLSNYSTFDFSSFFQALSATDIDKTLSKEHLSDKDFIKLLSPIARTKLESMAKLSRNLTLQHFGRAISLYTPMYISNYCVNQCLYCGFNATRSVIRKKLNPSEIEKEAKYIAATGLKHILLLTGESQKDCPIEYIGNCVDILKDYFSSITIEIYPLTIDEYKYLITKGVDGLTLYQEVYNQDIYKKVHIHGPKTNYNFRLNTPERGALAGMRTINIGALLGLDDWRSEAFFTGLHARYLQDKYPECEISVSIPRIQPQGTGFSPLSIVNDIDLTQIILALRIFLPRVGITLSTRENSILRDHLIPIGITKMSAGSTTAVGGHTCEKDSVQFNISDERDVKEIKKALKQYGYQPVLKDWVGVL